MSREPRVTNRNLRRIVGVLAGGDRDLAAVVAKHGPPPLWAREQGFATLVHIILEQQVSLASAQAAFDRLLSAVSQLEPRSFLTLTDERLRRIGFSRQKTGYCRELARAVAAGRLDLVGLDRLSTQAARDALLELRGVGRWTADIYLLMAQGRADIWPVGDLALIKAMQRVKGLDSVPEVAEFESLGEPWRPWRSVAARLLWHHYLEDRSNGAL